MKNTFPSYYKKFRCIADKCPDTCCSGWEIVVDPESLSKYSALTGGYGETVRSRLSVDGDGDTVFTSKDGRCPFLLENGLCEMYIELGEDSLCRTCRLFPRHITSFGARIETGISFSCPEAARLITESPEPITFQTEETDGVIEPTGVDPELYFTLIEARKKAFFILQNRNYSVSERMAAFLDFSHELSVPIRKNDFESAKKAIESEPNFCEIRNFNRGRAEKACNKYFSDFMSLEMLEPEWKTALEAGKSADYNAISALSKGSEAFDREYEHLCVYFVFRYFMTAAFDRDLESKAKFAAVSLIIIRRIQAGLYGSCENKALRIKVMQKFSKEIEHSENNMAAVLSFIRKSRFYSVENIINILSEQEHNT